MSNEQVKEMCEANYPQIIECPDYDIAGSEHKKTIILLHGTGITRKMWIPQMKALSHTYRFLAPDLPGHGSRHREKFTFKRAAANLNDLLDDNDCSQALVVGFSLGGYLASEFACRYPERTTGLVLVGSSTLPRGYVSVPYHLLAFFYRFISHKWLTIRDIRLWRSKYVPEISEPVIKGGFYHSVVPALEKEIGGRDFLAALKSYHNPVLMINGEKDHIFRKGEDSYPKNIRCSKLVIIKHAGHMCNLDAPDEFNRYLSDFADSLIWDL